MKIKKIGHCCLVIEDTIDGKPIKIVTDPGTFTSAQNEEMNVDAIVITHEHGDHFHIDSIKEILKNNPSARVITNTAVSKLLEKEGIAYEVIVDKDSTDVNGFAISGHGDTHAEIYNEFMTPVENTGYLFADQMFYPGDMFYDPGVPVEILALPVAGPWMNIKEAIDFARTVHPKVAFPVHDALYKDQIRNNFQGMFQKILEKFSINFTPLGDGETKEF